MSDVSSIFIDSASTYLPSYLALEQTISQLNHGKVPAIFLAGTTNEQRERLMTIASTRRFTHVTLPEKKDRNQNGLTWIRIEPVNVVPYPLTQMRGLFAAPVPANAVESLFTAGRLPEEQANRAFLFEQLVRTAYPLSDSDINLVLTLLAAQSPASNELPLQ